MPSNLFADISNNNGSVNLAEYAAAGHIFIAIKASEGTHFVDPDHRGWCYSAGGHRIGIAHYHFARPDLNSNPVDEADFFLEVALPLAGGRDYLVLDLERGTPQGWGHDPAWSNIFATRVRQRSRFAIILYASESTLRISDAWLPEGNRRVWDAAWGSGPDYAPPGYQCVFRQYTNGVYGPGPHDFAGIGQSDGNVIRGELWRQILRNHR